MATAISLPFSLRMEDRVREVRRLTERFQTETWPESVESRPTDVSRNVDEVRTFGRRLVTEVADLFDGLDRLAEAGSPITPELISDLWKLCCNVLEDWLAMAEQVRTVADQSTDLEPAFLAELDKLTKQLIDQMRYIIVAHPEWDLSVPDHLAVAVWTIRISPLNYLRSMANLFWSALRHPLSETTIDLSTGRVLYRT